MYTPPQGGCRSRYESLTLYIGLHNYTAKFIYRRKTHGAARVHQSWSRDSAMRQFKFQSPIARDWSPTDTAGPMCMWLLTRRQARLGKSGECDIILFHFGAHQGGDFSSTICHGDPCHDDQAGDIHIRLQRDIENISMHGESGECDTGFTVSFWCPPE